jgi:uncharacterized alpha-E superfamily protein
MLARTADNLYWLARYMERADFLARIVNVTRRLAALPTVDGGDGSEWESALSSAGVLEPFKEAYDRINAENVIEFLVFDTKNPSSIVNCIEYGRSNARAMRTALTIETWECINSGWLELKRFQTVRAGARRVDTEHLTQFLDMAMKLSLDVDGSSYRTMLRNDAYWFGRLGLYLERADNTARILDVKYNILLPESEAVGGSLDYFQWTAILRAVSAHTAYNWIYREGVKPWLIAELLILRPEMPRSLISCYENIVHFLDSIARAYGRQGASQHLAHAVLSRLQQTSTTELFAMGLHEYITQFVEDNYRLGSTIAEQYLLN